METSVVVTTVFVLGCLCGFSCGWILGRTFEGDRWKHAARSGEVVRYGGRCYRVVPAAPPTDPGEEELKKVG